MGTRREGRETALKILYLNDQCGMDLKAAEKVLWGGEDKIDPRVRTFARSLASHAIKSKDTINELLNRYVKNWELGRLASIDRNILRLSTVEMLIDEETPISVIIDEAVEIAKNYSTEESGKFVNGVLDQVKKERGKVKLA